MAIGKPMEAQDPKLVKDYGNGARLYNWNPADAFPDAENVNVGYQVSPELRGLTLDTAVRNLEKAEENKSKYRTYMEYVPCVECANCIIIREVEYGKYVNHAYICRETKRLCARYGTCPQATQGRKGPFIIEHDVGKAAVEAARPRLVN